MSGVVEGKLIYFNAPFGILFGKYHQGANLQLKLKPHVLMIEAQDDVIRNLTAQIQENPNRAAAMEACIKSLEDGAQISLSFLPHIEWPFEQFGNKSNEFGRIARVQRVQFK